MSMKKFDLAKQMGLKVTGQMKSAGVPGRFGQGAGDVLDKREQRKRDAALGLVSFACKLPAELTRQLQEKAVAHEGGMNGLVAGLLTQALAPAEQKAPAKKASKETPKEASKETLSAAADQKPAARKKPVSRTT